MSVPNGEIPVLVLQGGGALGAYQAGAFEALEEAGYSPVWVAGMSIGAINAAIICGNPASLRRSRLATFWERVTGGLTGRLPCNAPALRGVFSEVAAALVMAQGAPGFFRPRFPFAGFTATGALRGTSYYDTAPLHDTLTELVDFDYLADHGPRLSIGAVDVETGNFAYFDSTRDRIGPEHVIASGALPPGFPAVEIGGCHYWDTGFLANGIRRDRIEKIRRLIATEPRPDRTTGEESRFDPDERDPRQTCPQCGGAMRVIETFTRGQIPKSRAPPWEDAA